MGELSAKLTEGVKSHQIKTPSDFGANRRSHLPQEGGHDYSATKVILIRIFKVLKQKVNSIIQL